MEESSFGNGMMFQGLTARLTAKPNDTGQTATRGVPISSLELLERLEKLFCTCDADILHNCSQIPYA